MLGFILVATIQGLVILTLCALLYFSRGRESLLKKTLITHATAVENVYRQMVELDYRGWFQEDDEVGVVFEDLKNHVVLLRSIVIVDDDQPGGEFDEEAQEEEQLLHTGN